jgi:hypothetical protein
MISVNLPNAITVGIIAVITLLVVRAGFKMAGKSTPV